MSTSSETKPRRVGRFIGIFLALVLALGVALLFAPNLMAGKAAINALPANTGIEPPVLRDTALNTTIIDMAGNKVPVLKDGLYDRFRSNPPLSVIEKERPDLDLSWFKTLDKERKDVGFETYSPNFYYSNSSITAIYTADMDRIQELIPDEVRELVQPISYTPGSGLIAITS